jgi:hypothetical protein
MLHRCVVGVGVCSVLVVGEGVLNSLIRGGCGVAYWLRCRCRSWWNEGRAGSCMC